MVEPMVEVGHFALVLAFALALVQSVVPLVGARTGNERMMAVGGPVVARRFRAGRARLRGADRRLRAVRFLGRERVGELALAEAAALQDHRHLGQPRGLDAALGADPDLLRRAGRGLRRQSAGKPACDRAVGAGLDRRGLPALHPGDLQSLRPAVAGAVRGARPQPDPAGHRPRHPSAAALSRLCRLLGLLLLRRRRADRGPHRRRLGALGAAVDARRLDRS